MESRPQNPEFRNNPENFHPCINLAFNPYNYPNKNTSVKKEKGPKSRMNNGTLQAVQIKIPHNVASDQGLYRLLTEYSSKL